MLKKVALVSAIALFLLGALLKDSALAAPSDVNAAISNAQTAADTTFVLMSAALVLLISAGLAFFYGGMVRSRNILNTLMMSFVVMAIASTHPKGSSCRSLYICCRWYLDHSENSRRYSQFANPGRSRTTRHGYQ